jgi:hypothetical protein
MTSALVSNSPREPLPTSERLIVLRVGAIQFVNILAFMMVMPLVPDFVAALGIEKSAKDTKGPRMAKSVDDRGRGARLGATKAHTAGM